MKILIIFLSLFSFSSAFPQLDTVQTGIASYYAEKFEGRKTADGNTFSNTGMTAAHKTLPFGTKVKVTNLRNTRSVIVTINDRLPADSKRCIDLTQTAAKKLGFFKAGTTKVTLEIISDN